MLQPRTLDADELPLHTRSFETALTEALLKEYPVAAAVDQINDKFLDLLETMAALDLHGSLQSQPVQMLRDLPHSLVSVPTDIGFFQTNCVNRAA